jgi:hypothetical protein
LFGHIFFDRKLATSDQVGKMLMAEGLRIDSQNNSWEGPFDITIREPGLTQRHSRSSDSEEIEAFNEQIKAWSEKVKFALEPSIRSNNISGSRLLRSIKNTYQYDYGEIFRLGFSFARHGIFIHKGVGRGYHAQGGVVVKTSRTPGFNRQPKPWFNPVVESHLDELGEIIKVHNETAIVNSSRIFIR